MISLAETEVVSAPGRFEDSFARAKSERLVERLWDKDASLWSNEKQTADKIGQRLGWLDSVERLEANLESLRRWIEEASRDGYRDVLLLGMGGSSLCPLVLADIFADDNEGLRLHVLDTTDPLTIAELTKDLDWSRTIVLVASKSGGTIEVLSLYAHCRTLADASTKFVAITDPGTSLVALAKEDDFDYCLENPADIGGRYSALSYFGFFPALCLGFDFKSYMERVDLMLKASQVPVRDNPGLELAVFMAAAFDEGRDKLCLAVGDSLKSFALWIEQLVAESLGKEGKGIVPIAGAQLREFAAGENDRMIVAIGSKEEVERVLEEQGTNIGNGTPCLTIVLDKPHQIGAEFFRWEMATALAGAFLRVNPFDEPNVTESKLITGTLLEEYEKNSALPKQELLVGTDEIDLYGKMDWDLVAEPGDVADILRAFIGRIGPGEFVGILAYLPYSEDSALGTQALRESLSKSHGWLTTLGYGPRFLHSTGQLYKGGANNGHFIQLTCEDEVDFPIPGKNFSFSVLKAAQAAGDMQTLEAHGRRVLRCHFKTQPVEGFEYLKGLLDRVLEEEG